MRRIRSVSARAVSGHAAAPPRREMNSRRLMGSPQSEDTPYYIATGMPRCASQQNWLSMAEMGQFLLLPHRDIGRRFTSISRHTNI